MYTGGDAGRFDHPRTEPWLRHGAHHGDAGPTPPTDRTERIALTAGDIIAAGLPLSELFPAVSVGFLVWTWASIPEGISVRQT